MTASLLVREVPAVLAEIRHQAQAVAQPDPDMARAVAVAVAADHPVRSAREAEAEALEATDPRLLLSSVEMAEIIPADHPQEALAERAHPGM